MSKVNNSILKSIYNNRKKDLIVIRGARVHNLKNISLDLPRNKFIVLTGVSGSGKSSLAFDTIYAEGQRRFIESLSAYARQFLERMEKPDVDFIQGISPAIAIEQKTATRNPRSTVGTTTEIYDYLRLLFGRIGRTYCPVCGVMVERDSVRSIIQKLNEKAGERAELKVIISFPVPHHKEATTEQEIQNLKRQGFFRLLYKNELIDVNQQNLPRGVKIKDVQVMVDRIIFKKNMEDNRLADSIEMAFRNGNGYLTLNIVDDQEELKFSEHFMCSKCGTKFEEPDPRLFSFNNPYGACPKCQGFGRAIGIDMDLVVPNKELSIREGAIQVWTTPKWEKYLQSLLMVANEAGIRVDVPYKSLHQNEIDIIMNGYNDFDGINEFFKYIEKKAYKIYYRVLLSRYRGYTICDACNGSRLRKEALYVRVGGKTIHEVVSMPIEQVYQYVTNLDISDFERNIAARIIDELRKRLKYLVDVGIGYLTLDRQSHTLSGGESQRINLATALGSTLVGSLYVLDEPSIGLHPRDNAKLISIINSLRDIGNTVIVVEHDADMIRAADVVVDMGPKAGENGGEIVFAGSIKDLTKVTGSITAQYLSGKKVIPVPKVRRKNSGKIITIRGASENNLRNIDVSIPLNMFVVVTGVSGSGKSTLIHQILYSGLKRLKGIPSINVGRHALIEGADLINDIELVDQSPIGRTPRSNPITYIKAFDGIRDLFASTHAAKIHGYGPGYFSFNVPGGRCETCEGSGIQTIEMQFLADIELTCDDCKGKRFKKEVLEIRFHERNIDDILRMTVREAINFFKIFPQSSKIAKKLQVLDDVGLGYIRLGQSATTLSGGEAQRVKLAAHLSSKKEEKHTLFIFDEPTTGLHFDDIAKLLKCFDSLIEKGNSIVVIEHNMDIIKCADWIIDLGPDAGEKGGTVVVVGTPEDISRCAESYTGKFLRNYLQL